MRLRQTGYGRKGIEPGSKRGRGPRPLTGAPPGYFGKDDAG